MLSLLSVNLGFLDHISNLIFDFIGSIDIISASGPLNMLLVSIRSVFFPVGWHSHVLKGLVAPVSLLLVVLAWVPSVMLMVMRFVSMSMHIIFLGLERVDVPVVSEGARTVTGWDSFFPFFLVYVSWSISILPGVSILFAPVVWDFCLKTNILIVDLVASWLSSVPLGLVGVSGMASVSPSITVAVSPVIRNAGLGLLGNLDGLSIR